LRILINAFFFLFFFEDSLNSNQFYHLNEDYGSTDSLNSIDGGEKSGNSKYKNKFLQLESFKLKKSSSDFFDTKKKKKWTNLFGNKESKLVNSSSQIFVNEAERSGMVLDKMNNVDLKEALTAPKNNELYNMGSNQTGNLFFFFLFFFFFFK